MFVGVCVRAHALDGHIYIRGCMGICVYWGTRFNICQPFPPLILITEMPHTHPSHCFPRRSSSISARTPKMFCHYFAVLPPSPLIYHVDYYTTGLTDAKTAMNYFDLQKGVGWWGWWVGSDGGPEKNFAGFSEGAPKFLLRKKTYPLYRCGRIVPRSTLRLIS